MKRKCSNSGCGFENFDDASVVCPKCKTLLPSGISDAKEFTHEQEVKIAERVAASLDNSKAFQKHIVKGLVNRALAVIGTALLIIGGSYFEGIRIVNEKVDARLKQLDIETSNKIAFVQFSIQTNIFAQFQDSRIKEIISQVAEYQSSNMLMRQISPQIVHFYNETSNTLSLFEESLNKFEKDSTNALSKVRNATELSLLVANVNADDYDSCQKLQLMAFSDSEYNKIAGAVINFISARVSSELLFLYENPAFQVSFEGIDGVTVNKSSLEEFKKVLNANIYAWNKVVFLKEISEQSRFTKFERLDFVARELAENKSILIRVKAAHILSEESKIPPEIFYINRQIEWWNANKFKYTNSIPSVSK